VCNNALAVEFNARLVTDFLPHGTVGLTGEAVLKDGTEERSVYVQLLKVSPPFKTRFTAAANVVFKGSIKKFAALNGTRGKKVFYRVITGFRLRLSAYRGIGGRR
jgi:hypothetical protein